MMFYIHMIIHDGKGIMNSMTCCKLLSFFTVIFSPILAAPLPGGTHGCLSPGPLPASAHFASARSKVPLFRPYPAKVGKNTRLATPANLAIWGEVAIIPNGHYIYVCDSGIINNPPRPSPSCPLKVSSGLRGESRGFHVDGSGRAVGGWDGSAQWPPARWLQQRICCERNTAGSGGKHTLDRYTLFANHFCHPHLPPTTV